MIRSNQVTDMFRFCHDCTSTSPARRPCYFCLQADITIWVLRKVSKNAVLADTTFLSGSEDNSREELATASRCPGTLSSTRFSVILLIHSGRSRNGFPRMVSLSFLFGFSVSVGSCDGLTRTVPFVLSLLVDPGCCVGVTASCGEDVGDEVVAEPVDGPGTTIGTKFAVLHYFRLPFLMSCGF